MLVNSGCHYVFGSRIVGNVKDVLDANELRAKKVDGCDMGRILLFDRIIRNDDRNDGNSNLLMTSGRIPEVYIIDHNSAFDRDFDGDEFMRNHILRGFYSDVKPTDRDRFRNDVKSLVADGFISDVKSQIPDVWVDGLTECDAECIENVEYTIEKEAE